MDTALSWSFSWLLPTLLEIVQFYLQPERYICYVYVSCLDISSFPLFYLFLISITCFVFVECKKSSLTSLSLNIFVAAVDNKTFQRFRRYKVYHRSVSTDRPNDPSISLRSFRRIFGRRRSGDIEGRQKETNWMKKTVENSVTEKWESSVVIVSCT